MKRTLSLLVALALVFTMIPAVFATDIKDSIEMDELVPGMQLNPEPAEIGQPYETLWDEHYYTITPADAGKLQFTVENGTVAVQGATADENGYYAVEAGVEYTVIVTKAADATANPIWSAAVHTHTETYTDNGDGTHDATCSVCGETVVDNEAHADTDSDKACDSCGATLACAHTTITYTDNVDGTHDGVCSACGETVVDNEAHADADSNKACDSCGAAFDAKLLFYRTNASGGDLLLQDDIRASFIVRNTSSLGYEKIYLKITMGDDTTLVEKNDMSAGTTYRYAYVVRAPYMNTDFTLAIFGEKNGVTYQGEVMDFSVRKCVDAKMIDWHALATGGGDNSETAAKQCRLAMALLHYGARTQLQFASSIETGELATANLPLEYQQYLPQGEPAMRTFPTIDTTGKQVTLPTKVLMLQEKVKLSLVFKSTVAYTDKVTIEVKQRKSKDGEVITYTYTCADTACVELVNSKNIRFFFDKFASNQLRDELEITIYEDDVAVSPTFIITVDMMLNQSNYMSNETARELAYAILHYADCSKAVYG